MGSGTPEEAADWVRYIRAHHKGRVLYEIGNELYGKWQVGYPTLAELPPRTLAFSRAGRSGAHDAEIFAPGLGPMADGKWTAAQLTTPPGTFNYLSLHFILGTNHPVQENVSPDFVAAAAYALPYAVGPYFSKVQAQVDEHPDLHGKVHFAITEWLFNSKGYGERNFTNDTVLRHSDSVTLTDMTGSMEFAGVWKKREQVYAVPAFYAFQLYTVVKGDTLLVTTSDSGTYAISGGVRPLDNAQDVPYIDIVATRSSDNKFVTLLCVNRNLQQDVPTQFDLGTLRAGGAAHMEQISSVSRYERNDEIEPEHVVPVPSTLSVNDNLLRVTLPHESVSVIRVPIK